MYKQERSFVVLVVWCSPYTCIYGYEKTRVIDHWSVCDEFPFSLNGIHICRDCFCVTLWSNSNFDPYLVPISLKFGSLFLSSQVPFSFAHSALAKHFCNFNLPSKSRLFGEIAIMIVREKEGACSWWENEMIHFLISWFPPPAGSLLISLLSHLRQIHRGCKCDHEESSTHPPTNPNEMTMLLMPSMWPPKWFCQRPLYHHCDVICQFRYCFNLPFEPLNPPRKVQIHWKYKSKYRKYKNTDHRQSAV